MKMRAMNHLFVVITVLANILAAIAVQTGCHTVFGTVAVAISLVVSLGMYVRVVIGTAALRLEEKTELIEFAVVQKRDPKVIEMFSKWICNNDRDFLGARIVNIADAVDDNGDMKGYMLLMIGTRSTYDKICRKIGDTCTIINYWPLDMKQWGESILTEYLADEPIEELIDPDISDLVPGKG